MDISFLSGTATGTYDCTLFPVVVRHQWYVHVPRFILCGMLTQTDTILGFDIHRDLIWHPGCHDFWVLICSYSTILDH